MLGFKCKWQSVVGVLGIVVLAGFLITSCEHDPRNKLYPDVPLENIAKGKVLAQKYCQSCHMLPEPQWLDAATWEKGVLPQMGPRLGIFAHGQKSYPYARYDFNLSRDFYPSKPLITETEWQHILDYYTATAPDTQATRQARQTPIQNNLPFFEPAVPPPGNSVPTTVLVQVDTTGSENLILASDAAKKTITWYDKNLKQVASKQTVGPVVYMENDRSRRLACDIGIMNPNNAKWGKAIQFTNHNKKAGFDSTVLFSGLARPVQITAADLNKDGREDYLVCEFGFYEGALSWMESTGGGAFKRHVLRPLPGAIKAYIRDENKDGLPDIWVLFTQGEEGIFLFTNKGGGQFEQRQVLRFPALQGSSFFELKDFNKDGALDIVYTCGDNADYSTVLKPFHGVYIFTNDGRNNFQQQYFFPINGCFKAIAADYDRDGDLDIATISYFPDAKNQPEEGFVYLEHRGNYQFKPYSLPLAQTGRWLTMDAGDVDKDGKIDLVLGNFSLAPAFNKPKTDWRKGPSFLLLKNITN